MAGFSVECLLKASLMKKLNVLNLADLERVLGKRGNDRAESTVFTHNLEELLELTGGLGRLRRSKCWRAFSVVNRWTPS